MKKLKNGFLDIFLFYLYHSLVVVGSVLLLLTLTMDINVFDIQAIKKAILGKADTPVPEVKIIKPRPLIKKIRGTVLVSDTKSSTWEAKVGEELKQGNSIETKEKSTVLLSFGDKYSCTMRLGSRSKINIDDLMRQEGDVKTEKSLINLIRGTVSVIVTNKSADIQIGIKTKHAAFGVRGTKFSVLTDNLDYSLLAVKEGKVEADNFISFKKKLVSADASLLINKDGIEKDSLDIKIIDRFDWNLENIDSEFPDIDEMLSLLGNPDFTQSNEVTTKSAEPESIKPLIEVILIELEAFKRYDKDLQDYLSNEMQYLNELQSISNIEKPKIESDIHCLSVSKKQCSLYSEKLLVSRDFPRTFGTPRFIQMMINDLRKYLKEQDDKIVTSKKDIAELEALILKRKTILESVELQFKNSVELEIIISRLKEKELLRK
jgi:hypothetical protein